MSVNNHQMIPTASSSSKERRRKRRLVDPDKRKRIAVACETCKKRKKKCNGSQPCKLCDMKGYSCVYIQRPSSPTAQPEESSINNDSMISGDYNNNSASPTVSPKESSIIDQSSPPDCSNSSSTQCFQYIGQSCTISLIEQIRHLLRTSNSGLTLSNDFLSNSYIDAPYPNPSINYPIQLPTRDQADKLVSLFVENIQVITYVFDMDVFYHSLNQIYQQPQQQQYDSCNNSRLCLLYLVFALGAVYDDECKVSSTLFFDSGRKILDSIPITYGEIWVVEAFLLVYLYHEIKCRRNGSWVELGKAIRHAQALGMDKDLINNDNHRRKLWKSLYIHDRLTSTYLGRSSVVSNLYLNHISTPLDQFVSLCDIIGDIHHTIYESQNFTSISVGRLFNSLREWSSSAALIDDDKLKTLLDLTYFHSVILLTRPFLFHISVNNTNNIDTFNNLAMKCIKSAFSTIQIILNFNNNKNLTAIWKSPTIVYYLFTAGSILLLYGYKQQRELKTTTEQNSTIIYSTLDDAINHLSKYSEIDTSAKQFYLTLTELYDIIKTTSPLSSPQGDSNVTNFESSLFESLSKIKPNYYSKKTNNERPPTPPPNNNEVKSEETYNVPINIDGNDNDDLKVDFINENWTFTSRGPFMADTPIEGVIMTPCY